jgi:hypothetical protein
VCKQHLTKTTWERRASTSTPCIAEKHSSLPLQHPLDPYHKHTWKPSLVQHSTFIIQHHSWYQMPNPVHLLSMPTGPIITDRDSSFFSTNGMHPVGDPVMSLFELKMAAIIILLERFGMST